MKTQYILFSIGNYQKQMGRLKQAFKDAYQPNENSLTCKFPILHGTV